jgi:hypothetical protein
MKVTINFKIDRELLEVAIRSLIFNKIRMCEKNIREAIKSQVETKGRSCIDFPENWGDDLFEFDYDEDYIEKQVEKYSKYLIEL